MPPPPLRVCAIIIWEFVLLFCFLLTCAHGSLPTSLLDFFFLNYYFQRGRQLVPSSNTEQKECEGGEAEGVRRRPGRDVGGGGGMLGWGLRNSVYVWFGRKGPELGSQENNGREREEKGRFMDVCAPSQVVGTLAGGCVCTSVCSVH